MTSTPPKPAGSSGSCASTRKSPRKELATAAGYSRASCISNVETGYRAIPDGKLLKVARYLGVDADKIRKPAVKAPR